MEAYLILFVRLCKGVSVCFYIVGKNNIVELVSNIVIVKYNIVKCDAM